MGKKVNIHVGYVITPLDASNYEIKAKLFDDDRNQLKDITRKVSMSDFNALLVYSDEDHAIKTKAEEIVKNAMYNAMAKLLEDDIKRSSALLELLN
jgi:hypothetical protein